MPRHSCCSCTQLVHCHIVDSASAVLLRLFVLGLMRSVCCCCPGLLCGTMVPAASVLSACFHTLLSSYLAVWLVNDAGKVSETGAVVHFVQHNHLQGKARATAGTPVNSKRAGHRSACLR
jgi:hypothetical protein